MSTFYKGYKGSRKKFRDDLNLVPFIDLFSTVILFLLATAVFDKLAAVPIALGDKSEKAEGASAQVAVKPVSSSIKIIITSRQVTMVYGGRVRSFTVEKDHEDYSKLETFLTQVRRNYPTKIDMLIMASHSTRKGIRWSFCAVIGVRT